MRDRLIPLPYRKVSRALMALGFLPIRQVGSHVRFRHPDGRSATVPHHAGSDISPSLLRRITREAGVTVQEFLDAV